MTTLTNINAIVLNAAAVLGAVVLTGLLALTTIAPIVQSF